MRKPRPPPRRAETIPTELHTPVTICAFAACAASITSFVMAPAERVAVPASRSTLTSFIERRLMSRWGLPLSFWRDEDRPWQPLWARKWRLWMLANLIWKGLLVLTLDSWKVERKTNDGADVGFGGYVHYGCGSCKSSIAPAAGVFFEQFFGGEVDRCRFRELG